MFENPDPPNRGEIALRISTCVPRDGNQKPVAVHSEPDAEAKYVKLRRRIGLHRPAAFGSQLPQHPASSARAEVTDAEAIHRGYGFLSGKRGFSRSAVETSGFVFIGAQS